MKAGLLRLEHDLKLALGYHFHEALVIRVANMLLGLLFPGEVTMNGSVLEGEEDVKVNGIVRREHAGHMGAILVVRQELEVEFGEES